MPAHLNPWFAPQISWSKLELTKFPGASPPRMCGLLNNAFRAQRRSDRNGRRKDLESSGDGGAGFIGSKFHPIPSASSG